VKLLGVSKVALVIDLLDYCEIRGFLREQYDLMSIVPNEDKLRPILPTTVSPNINPYNLLDESPPPVFPHLLLLLANAW
jgi:hypothetical protein